MDHSRIIRGAVGGGRYTVTAPITQWDYGYVFIPEIEDLPATYRLDFANDEHHGTALSVYCGADGGEVPEELIDTGKDIFVWFFYVGDGFGKTEYKWRIPNKCKPKGGGETPEPSQQSSIDQLISVANEAIDTAQESASQASASAQNASADAERAEEARTDAQNYAESASGYASDAQGYANTASQKATEAGNSADQAAQIKTDIEGYVSTAQTAAQTATDKAAQASQSATNASNSATTASTKAGEASASATTASNKAGEASASATTASNKATEASGYANTASQKASDASDSASAALGYKTDAESAKTAAQTAQGLAEDAQEAAETAAASVSASAAQIAQNEADILKAFPTDSASGAIASFLDGADNIPLKSLIVNIDPVQDLSNGDPSPENICPISGWTGANVSASGKNLCDMDAYTVPSDSAWHILWEGDLTGTYTVSLDKSGVTSVEAPDRRFLILTVDDNYVYVSYNQTSTITGRLTKIYCVGGNSYARVQGTIRVQIELGSEATAYEPYNGTLIPISWQSEAGTVYGGKLDVLNGKLIATYGIADLGDYNWSMTGTSRFYTAFSPSAKIATTVAERTQGMICSCYPFSANTGYADTMEDKSMLRGGNESAQIMIKDTTYSDKTTFKAAMSGVQLCYELAEPIEVQLSPTETEVRSLLGQNNIFADTGDTEVTYLADPTLYIQRLTEPDADMIADSNIVSGQYFMVGNNLYKATANIASGAQVIVGTNCIRKSLSEALNEINA